MGRTKRLAVALLATLLVLVSWAPRAHAVGNTDAAKRAGDYVAAQAATTTDVSAAADSLLALAAVGDAALAPQATQLLGDRYERLQITFDPSETIPMDAADKLGRMEALAQALPLDAVAGWIGQHWL